MHEENDIQNGDDIRDLLEEHRRIVSFSLGYICASMASYNNNKFSTEEESHFKHLYKYIVGKQSTLNKTNES